MTGEPVGTVAAVDLGTAVGRVVVGHVGPKALRLEEAHRFTNEPVALPDGIHWDVLHLYRESLAGLQIAARGGAPPLSVGVDAWGSDFGLLDTGGALVGNPSHARDGRQAAGADVVHARARPASLYMRTGIGFEPTTSLYQLAALDGTDAFARAGSLLLVPDLMGYWLTGEVATDEVPPTAYAIPRSNVLRPDEVTPSLTTEEVLANAPEVESDRFKVPRVVEVE